MDQIYKSTEIEANSTVETSRLRAPLTCRAAEFDRRHSLYRIPHRWTVLLVWVEAVRLLAIKSVVEPVRRPGEMSTNRRTFQFCARTWEVEGKFATHVGQIQVPPDRGGTSAR